MTGDIENKEIKILEKDEKGALVELKKYYRKNNNIQAQFATEMTITHSEDVLYLAFYRTEPPFLINEESLKHLKGVDAELLAKIIVTPKLLESMIDIMGKNLEALKERKKELK